MNQVQIGFHRRSEPKKFYIFQFLYMIAFSLAISAAIIGYANSSYLQKYIDAKYIGLVFTGAYLVAFFSIGYFSHVMRYLGRTRTLVLLVFIQIIALLIFGLSSFPALVLFCFVVLMVVTNLLLITYDVHLEHFSNPAEKGRIRGSSLTVINLAWLMSPTITGFLLSRFDFPVLYIVSAVALVPILALAFLVRDGVEKPMHHRNTWVVLKKVVKNKPLFSVFYLVFLLQFFYAWMVIYTPLYLLSLGYGWDTIGPVFTIMLLPFVLLQFPAGYMADRFWGETEMLSVGIIVMSLATFAFFWVQSIWVIAIVLFFTRVGASLIEELTDTYFFKHVHDNDVDIINYYRNVRPLAYILAPAIASLIMLFFPMHALFLFLSAFILTGLFFSFSMPDTK